MYLAIDFGTTNTDVIICDELQHKEFYTFPTQTIDLKYIEKILSATKAEQTYIKYIGVTGGKSSDLPDKLKNIPICKINEVDAIALGAAELYVIKNEPYVVTSTGTGTACVYGHGDDFTHLGGISVGGGTLQGLSNYLLDTIEHLKIDQLSVAGDRKNLDLLIGDVVNEIGSLYPNITAANLAKARDGKGHSNEDMAASISNMVGEVIGTISYLNALLMGVKKVFFIGRLSLNSVVKKGIEDRLKLAGVEGVFVKDREYGNAFGVLRSLQAK